MPPEIRQTLFFCIFISSVSCISFSELYPYEDLVELEAEDDSAAEIEANPPVHLYGHIFETIYVNTNGLLSFEREISPYRPDFEIPFDYFNVIAPFYADIDTRNGGKIYYGKTTDSELLKRAAADITASFSKYRSFQPTSLYIFTWIDVGYYNKKNDKSNTFQLVLVSDGEKTFAIFLYPEDKGLGWFMAEDKDGIQSEKAQVGFSAITRFYELPGSKFASILDLTHQSNVDKPGVWIFLSGSAEGNVENSESVVTQKVIPQDHYPLESTNEENTHSEHSYFHPEHPEQPYPYPEQPYPYPEQPHPEQPYPYPKQPHPEQPHPEQPYPYPEQPYPYPEQPHPEQPYPYPEQPHPGQPYPYPEQPHPEQPYPYPEYPYSHPVHPHSEQPYPYPENPYPHPEQPRHEQPSISSQDTEFCSSNSQCHSDAYCQDFSIGYCCYCKTDFIGNGKTCIPEETKIRLSGNILGVINNQMLPEFKASFYAILKNGRSFSLISDLDEKWKNILSYFPSISTIFGFLFGLKQDSNAKHGFEYTGGSLTRIVKFEFENGHKAELRQMLVEDNGNFNLHTEITGNVPDNVIDPNSELKISPIEYLKIDSGRFSSSGQYNLTLTDGSITHANFQESIMFTECLANPKNYLESIKVSFINADIKYKVDESSLRFPLTSHISVGRRIENPCNPDPCTRKSFSYCLPVGESFECNCHRGYVDQGDHCVEENIGCRGEECEKPDYLTCGQTCHSQASCQFDHELHKYECKCLPGLDGDGITYCNENPCSHLYCDPNAQCIYDDEERSYKCQCPSGTTSVGEGRRCDPNTQSCRESNNCDHNAECTYDYTTNEYLCVCNPGFHGNGYQCMSETVHGEECSPHQNNCDENARCEYNYQELKYKCTCNSGFEGDGRYCSRLDCAKEPSLCDRNAHCEQTDAGYLCVCNQDFEGDGIHFCRLKVDKALSDTLIFAQGNYLGQVPSNENRPGHAKLLSFERGSIPVAVDVDCAAQKIYWTDLKDHSIHSSNIDGTDSKVIVPNLEKPEGVAIDWVSGNIYWTDTGTNTIQVARNNGSNIKTLLRTNITKPRSIAVDPVRGLIFWSDWDWRNPKIESSNLDGSDRKILVQERLKNPNGLAIDHESQFVCWADSGTKKVECVTYTGRNRRVIAEDTGLAFGLAYHNGYFYWTDRKEKNYLKRVGKHSTDPAQLISITPGVSGILRDLSVIKATCPHGTNPCSHKNGGCEYLCFASLTGGRTCGCSDDIDKEECKRSTMYN